MSSSVSESHEPNKPKVTSMLSESNQTLGPIPDFCHLIHYLISLSRACSMISDVKGKADLEFTVM